MNIYIGVERVTDELLALLRAESGVRGVVLGDYACNRRMFSGGFAGMMRCVQDVSNSGKEIIAQTPMYLTERNYDDVVETTLFLRRSCGVRGFLVQDVGFAKRISRDLPDVNLIWSQMGRNRGSLINLEFVRFLKSIGIKGLELSAPGRLRALAQVGLAAWACYGGLSYATVSRGCYNQHTDAEYQCKRECLHGEHRLEGKHKSLTIDGHFLGRRIVYDDAEPFWTAARECGDAIIVRAENAEEVRRRYYITKERLFEHE